jgi:hypothetical protein
MHSGKLVLFESSRESIFNMMTPSEVLEKKLAKTDLEALERTLVSDIDP